MHYEYVIIKSKIDNGNLPEEILLNKMGNDGWELVGISHDKREVGWLYFKKPIKK